MSPKPLISNIINNNNSKFTIIFVLNWTRVKSMYNWTTQVSSSQDAHSIRIQQTTIETRR